MYSWSHDHISVGHMQSHDHINVGHMQSHDHTMLVTCSHMTSTHHVGLHQLVHKVKVLETVNISVLHEL